MLTKENFDSEVLKSDRPTLVYFKVEKGCGFCDKFAPLYEDFTAKHPEIKCLVYPKDTLQTPNDEIADKYGIKGYPTVISFDRGELLKVASGMQTEEQMIEITKTIYNVTDLEIQQAQLDLQGQEIELKKQLLNVQVSLGKVNQEIHKRIQGIPPQPKQTEEECLTECESKCEDEPCKTKCREYCKHITLSS